MCVLGCAGVPLSVFNIRFMIKNTKCPFGATAPVRWVRAPGLTARWHDRRAPTRERNDDVLREGSQGNRGGGNCARSCGSARRCRGGREVQDLSQHELYRE